MDDGRDADATRHLATARSSLWRASVAVGLAVLLLAGWALWQQMPGESDGVAADYVQVRVVDVRPAEERSGRVLILREVDGDRRLTMVVGEAEALAIALQLAGQRPPRPMTHDLLRAAVEALEGRVTRVQVTRLEAGTFYAVIVLSRGHRVLEVDARPSDAIALALRVSAPIFAQRALLESDRQRGPSTPF